MRIKRILHITLYTNYICIYLYFRSKFFLTYAKKEEEEKEEGEEEEEEEE